MASIGYLPEELLTGILARVPVKSLLRFKCVCKQWYDLIQNPNFITNHFQIPKNHTRLLVLHKTRNITTEYYEDHGLNYDSDSLSCWDTSITDEQFALLGFPDETLACHQLRAHEYIIDFIQVFPYAHNIIGPVNGLFLLQYYGDDDVRVALWNPATTDFRLLPLPTAFEFPPHYCCGSHVFGFGLDNLTNDYKVIWIPIMNGEPSARPIAALYKLGTDSWRVIEAEAAVVLPSAFWLWGLSKYSRPMYLNGANYWLLRHKNKSRIVLFDFGSEVFREIQIPDKANGNGSGTDEHAHPNLGLNLVLHNDDSIALLLMGCVSGSNSVLESIEMWVMTQEEEGCWNKHFTLGLGPHLQLRKPLGFWKNDYEMFFETCAEQLVLYNTNTHAIRELGLQGECSRFALSLAVFNYKESLVSVGGHKASNRDKLHDMAQDFFKRGKSRVGNMHGWW